MKPTKMALSWIATHIGILGNSVWTNDPPKWTSLWKKKVNCLLQYYLKPENNFLEKIFVNVS